MFDTLKEFRNFISVFNIPTRVYSRVYFKKSMRSISQSGFVGNRKLWKTVQMLVDDDLRDIQEIDN